eukprot:CAMPEP_0118683136 /NCGR_PEP_ID=MMETSP0800-20121206/5867_1 /TAXON_ID=210618 ORGANISM="Striatella unipunctata, Strain CCMP2910" /NCGR_SAMPLE_ID=MMETSP0800 /ASSEMBLY_ACC=CAM_ASM_000638 /LENGTH=248 /DNA_ID=CAMNT_0006579591 /DNA_START=170 /DNA_END=913 /DNA_ORIENTATION=+
MQVPDEKPLPSSAEMNTRIAQGSPFHSIFQFLSEIRRESPTLFCVAGASLLVHILWHIPVIAARLPPHFICSSTTVLSPRYHLHAVLLSVLSHSSWLHMGLNVYGFLALGQSVQKTLSRLTNSKGTAPMWHIVLGSALAGSLMFMGMGGLVSCMSTSANGGPSGCMGLSGVTLALWALHTKLLLIHPRSHFKLRYNMVPLQQVLLSALFVTSFLGSFMQSTQVAHATHLGGIIFGMFYHQYIKFQQQS